MLSLYKSGSNVVEKCLQYAPPDKQQEILDRFVGMPMVKSDINIFSKGDSEVTLANLMDSKFGNYVIQRVYSMCDKGSKAILVAKIRELGSSGLLNLKAGSKAIHVIKYLEGLGVKFDFMDALSHASISNGVFKPD